MEDLIFRSVEEIDFWIQTVYIPFVVKDVLKNTSDFNAENDIVEFSQALFENVENKKKILLKTFENDKATDV